MKVKYTLNENYYVLTNFSVSVNPVFLDKDDIRDFKNRLIEKLSPICDLHQFLFNRDQYQILVRLKSREIFEAFYRKKKLDKFLEATEIPESTYILSQEMANIQSGYAKHFNFKYSRYGAVFGRRYTKILLSTTKEILHFLNRLKKGIKYWFHERYWSFKYRFGRKEIIGDLVVMEEVLSISENNLQGHPQNPP